MRKLNLLSAGIQAALFSGVIYSASAIAEEVEVKDEVERIEVTGSRILREGAIAPSPVTVITGDDLLKTGAVSIAESLRNLPALNASATFQNNNQSSVGTAGLSTLNLRNMGSARTLVLVDGKRHVAGEGGTASVDINTIPTAWVDRVEIITGGASAIYGADAVTGVVNFILKKNVTGLDVSATNGASELSAYKTSRYSISYGTDFDDGRGNIAVAAEYANNNGVKLSEHPWTSESSRDFFDHTQNPDTPDFMRIADAGLYKVQEGGLGEFWDGYATFNEDGSQRPLYLGSSPDYQAYSCVECDYTNLNQYFDIRPEFERSNFNLKANYDITDDINVYFDAKYVKSESVSRTEPSFWWVNFDISHPFMTRESADRMTALGMTDLWVNRQNIDLGQRTEVTERETTRFVLGTEGYINDDWGFDVSLVRGETEIDRKDHNNLVFDNFYNALYPIVENGEIVCGDPAARADGCVPFNYMGGENEATQEVRDYLNKTSNFITDITQTVFSASVNNGQLFEFPAGDVGFAAGIEYRKEENDDEGGQSYEGTFQSVIGEADGEFDVTEVFVEVVVPLVTDVFLVQDLSLDTAVRFADYSTIGDATSWKVGIDWAVNDELRFRATQSEAIRAPNLGELFMPSSQDYAGIQDPCKSSNLESVENNGTRIANCAALGVPADFDSNYDYSNLPLSNGGNPDLQAEESTSTTVGFVYQPEFIENFTATVDYWNIEIDEAIGRYSYQELIDGCVDDPSGIDNKFCSFVTRGDNSEINDVFSQNINTALLKTAGVDIELSYSFDALGASFNTNLIAQHKLENTSYTDAADRGTFEEFEGTLYDPEWSGLFNLGMNKDNVSASWNMRYTSAVDVYTPQSLARNPNPSNIMDFGSYIVSDATLGYNFENGLSVTVGVDNIFNKRLPFAANYDAHFDNMGRYGYLTVTYSM